MKREIANLFPGTEEKVKYIERTPIEFNAWIKKI